MIERACKGEDSLSSLHKNHDSSVPVCVCVWGTQTTTGHELEVVSMLLICCCRGPEGSSYSSGQQALYDAARKTYLQISSWVQYAL